jgi:hypothetical protein
MIIHKMAFPKSLNELCRPSYIYFIISVIGMVAMAIQNMGNNKKYCLGSFSCHVPNTIAIFAIKVVYILFWTWILNLMCKDGHSDVAWFLVLLPFVMLFVVIGLLMVYQQDEERVQMNNMKNENMNNQY